MLREWSTKTRAPGLGCAVEIRALLLVVLAAGACGRHEREALQLRPCRDLPSGLLCGDVPVPENRELADGRQIELSVVVAPAIEPRAGAAPMFVLEGGPGGAASKDAAFYMSDGESYRKHRDVVMVDLRGTGRSGALRCSAIEDASLERQLAEMYPAEQVEACRASLEEVADLTQYTTRNGVDDLETVRARLGYDDIVLHGTSYGTRLGQEYLRRYPERVRSFIGIGTIAPDHAMPLRHAQGFQRAFDLLLSDCELDEACRSSFPDLRERWVELLSRLDAEPARVRYTKGSGQESARESSRESELSISRDVFVSKLRSTLYFASAGRQLPFVVDAASRGDFGPFIEMIEPSGQAEESIGIAEGLYLSVTCSEDVPRITDDEVARLTQETYQGSYRVDQQRRACDHWVAGSSVALEEPVTSSVPALLVTGERDPVTPPSDAQTVAQALSRARVVVVPHAGHLPYDGSDPLCVDTIILQFLETEDPGELDVSCLEGLEPLPFVLGGAGN